jgi:hypothetical protein
VLERFEPKSRREDEHDAAVLDLLVGKVRELERAGIRKSARELADEYKGQFQGYGKHKLRRLIDEALATGRLFSRSMTDAANRPREVVSLHRDQEEAA